jgi:hypothetical protein
MISIIFDLVLNTNPDKFLTWFFHDWEKSIRERFTCESGEYTVEMEYFEPGESVYIEPNEAEDDEKFVTHEIDINGIPYSLSEIEIINPDETKIETYLGKVADDRKKLALGYMTVLEIANEKIHVQGIATDDAPFDYYLMKIGERISDIFSPIHKHIKGAKPESPEKPSIYDPDEKWFDYYHWCKYEGGLHYTLEHMSKDRSISSSTIRKLHIGCPVCGEKRAMRRNKKNKIRNN